ncbi:hypothetical protein E2C01_102413 [Portunus trituberculatus]|uniref:Uncharacterized protein n=1 Tax=Portunus trituberculatus TaxID=210409 RepID=A0A5B7KIB3_PORTR|nr:hypothetical protein [Portunus trituberculatus]
MRSRSQGSTMDASSTSLKRAQSFHHVQSHFTSTYRFLTVTKDSTTREGIN